MSKNFLQSEEWRKFQESVGRKTFLISGENFCASIIEHHLPVVGKYFYIPRGPIICHPELDSGSNLDSGSEAGMTKLLDLAKKEKAGWIRFDADNSHTLDIIRKNLRVVKAPHDMQPKEIFVMDITKPEEQLLAEMKAKTRYNIKLSQERGVSVKVISSANCYPELDSGSNLDSGSEAGMTGRYFEEFLRLVKVTAERQGIASHPEDYYRKMLETIPGEILKLYVAEYENKVIAANLMIFYGDTAIYLHGASDNEYRNVMATYLLQWRAIQDAKKAGFAKYDFGGVKIMERNDLTPALSLIRRGNKGEVNSWSGITKFKTGFSPNTQPVEFPGSYDIVINPIKYWIYRILQKIKSFK